MSRLLLYYSDKDHNKKQFEEKGVLFYIKHVVYHLGKSVMLTDLLPTA